jgi:hypothetical protein
VQRRRVRHTRIGEHVRFAPEHVAELIDAGEQPVTVRAQVHAAIPLHDQRRSRL